MNERGLTDLRQKILHLAHAGEVIGIRAVFGELQRSEMEKSLDFQVERFFELEARRERRGRFTEPTLPFGEFRDTSVEARRNPPPTYQRRTKRWVRSHLSESGRSARVSVFALVIW